MSILRYDIHTQFENLIIRKRRKIHQTIIEEGATASSRLAIALTICYMGTSWMLINLYDELEYL